MYSLQARLGGGLLIVLIPLFIVLWLVVGHAIFDVAEDNMAARLVHDSESLLSGVSFENRDGSEKLIMDDRRMGAIYHRPFSGHYFQILHDGQWTVSRSLWDRQLQAPLVSVGETRRLYLLGPRQQRLLALASGYRKSGHDLVILVAEDLSDVAMNVRVFQWRFAIIASIILVLLVVAGLFMVRAGLRPLQRIKAELRALEHGERRQLTVAVPVEIRPLVNEINQLIDLLGKRLQRSRHALGDLAHALKKPLTVMRQLQDGNRGEDRDGGDSGDIMAAQLNAMGNIINRQLQRARLAGEDRGGVYFDVNTDLPPMLEAMRKMYYSKALVIESNIEGNPGLAVDREDVLELLGNILDNACKWARKNIRLTMKMENAAAIILIEDDGPGIDAQSLDELSRRGKRLDEHVEGHGLGLAIVKDIVEQYGASLRFSNSGSYGGLSVRIMFPRMPAS